MEVRLSSFRDSKTYQSYQRLSLLNVSMFEITSLAIIPYYGVSLPIISSISFSNICMHCW